MTRFCIGLIMIGCLVSLEAGEPAKKFEQTPDEVKLFELTNQERKKKDVAPLKLNPALSKLARAHAENMARQGKLEHVLDEKDPYDRMRDAGYKYMTAGENIAYDRKDAKVASVLEGWMESKGHAENILSPQYTEIGIGIAKDKDGQQFYTQLFAKPLKQ